MNIQKIILSFLVILFWLYFILSITYFKNSSSFENFSIPQKFIGLTEIVSWENEQKEITSENLEENKLYKDGINSIDSVYIYSKNYTKTQVQNDINFQIWEGIYIFDLYDLSYNYSIQNKDFSLTPKSPGRFFIDSRKVSDIKIFSFDSILNVDLIGTNGEEKITSLLIYPHIFFWFNAQRNKFLMNADILRLESVSKILYINENFVNEKQELNQKFVKKLYSSQDKASLQIFESFLAGTYSKSELAKYDRKNIELYKNKNIFWLSYIEKYFLFFLNREKKISYYKKDSLAHFNILFENTDIPKSESQRIKNQIIWNFKHLQTLDEKEYIEFKKVLLYYYDVLLKINSSDFIDNALILSEIVLGIENKQKSFGRSAYVLNKMYSLVDSNIYKDNYLQTNLLVFLNDFMQENQLLIQNGNLLIEKNQENNFKIDYLTFFLKNILLYDVSFWDKKSFDNILHIYQVYLLMNDNLKNNYNNVQKTETILVEYYSILTKMLLEMKTNLFSENLNDRGLLVLNNHLLLSNEQVEKLNNIFQHIYSFYMKNKSALSEKNSLYNSLYSKWVSEYKEYYAALSNYPEYLIKYDNAKTQLLNTSTIFESREKEPLSTKALTSYLSQFEGLDISQISYKIMGGDFYRISKTYVNSEEFSFDLYPYEWNRIDNILRNGKKLTLSYELDSLKLDLKTLYEDAEPENKHKYDFKRFFINTFFNKDENIATKFQWQEDRETTEDRTITFFKRDKLFWDRWDFQVLKWYLDIKYEDVNVVLGNNNEYKITIKKWVLKTTLQEESLKGNNEVIAIIRADYVFSNTDHYFKNIYVKFLDSYLYNRWEEQYLYSGKEFRIFRNIDTLKFKEQMNIEITKIFTSN